MLPACMPCMAAAQGQKRCPVKLLGTPRDPGKIVLRLYALSLPLMQWARNVSQAKLLQPSDPLHEWRARCQQHYHWAIL